METMYLIVGLVCLGIGAGVGFLLGKKSSKFDISQYQKEAELLISRAREEAERIKKEALVQGKEDAQRLRKETEEEIRGKKRELNSLEKRLQQKEAQIEKKQDLIDRKEIEVLEKETALKEMESELERQEKELQSIRAEAKAQLEKISNMTQQRQENRRRRRQGRSFHWPYLVMQETLLPRGPSL